MLQQSLTTSEIVTTNRYPGWHRTNQEASTVAWGRSLHHHRRWVVTSTNIFYEVIDNEVFSQLFLSSTANGAKISVFDIPQDQASNFIEKTFYKISTRMIIEALGLNLGFRIKFWVITFSVHLAHHIPWQEKLPKASSRHIRHPQHFCHISECYASIDAWYDLALRLCSGDCKDLIRGQFRIMQILLDGGTYLDLRSNRAKSPLLIYMWRYSPTNYGRSCRTM